MILLRRYLRILLVVILAHFAISVFADAPDWEQVGTVGFSDGVADSISSVYDSDGNLYVGHIDCGETCGVTVRKWDGIAWDSVRPEKFTGGFPQYASIAIDSNDVLYAAYAKCESLCGVTVRRYNGTSWEVVGSEEFSAGGAENISLAINSNDVPYVAYKDMACTDGCGITVKKYEEGGLWSNVGVVEFSDGEMSYSSITFDSNDNPYVAFSDWVHGGGATIMYFDGASWNAVGTPGVSDNQTGYLVLKLDEDNVPYIAFVDQGGVEQNPYVMKFDGVDWVDVGTQPVGNGISGYTSLAFDSDNNPLVAFMDGDHDYKGVVLSFNGSAWASVGSPYFTAGQASAISLSVSPAGTVYMAYQDLAHDNKLSVMKYDGTDPVISEVTPVENPTTDTTPSYTFRTNEAGTIGYDGGCTSVTTVALPGDNTIIFDELPLGDYADCTIVVTDASDNGSNILHVSDFSIVVADVPAPPAPDEETNQNTYGSLPNSGVIGVDPSLGTSGGIGGVVLKELFTKDLSFEMIDPDVKRLQVYLNEHGFILATEGGGSPGHETDYFGAKTRGAVTKFQEAHRLEILLPLNYLYGTGIFGPMTRAFVNANL